MKMKPVRANRVLISTEEVTVEAHRTIEDEPLSSLIYEALGHATKGNHLFVLEVLAESAKILQTGYGIDGEPEYGKAMQRFTDDAVKFLKSIENTRAIIRERYTSQH